MSIFDLQNMPTNVLVCTPHDTPKLLRAKLHWSEKRKMVTGFNAGGNDFDADGRCKEAPWVTARPSTENK